MEQNIKQTPKYAFYYMLSLVALIFLALSSGVAIFQIINKNIVDILENFQTGYSSELIKFAISALFISAPVYYLSMRAISKSLFSGAMDKDSAVRRWLTYFILFVASVVMLGWLIGILNSFLNGDLTSKFILKALTALLISASIFYFYFYDIKRAEVVNVKNKVITIYFYSSLVFVIAVLVSAFMFVESPTETRNIKYDIATLQNFSQIENALNIYYDENKKLPENLDKLVGWSKASFLTDKILTDKITNKKYEYRIKGKNNYELCADFKTSNKDKGTNMDYNYIDELWLHDKGYQCLEKKIAVEEAKIPATEKETAKPTIKK